ncbi:AAA family ATPase [Streptomyces xiamenensis]|uniref:helix-turn-helix transcriptional regulator n=1 Tax=Streptomyces xiamenensis TaxID=408015 RepID=UPI0036E382CE
MDLIGRARETEALRGMLARTARGRGGGAIINGPVGCGKTELLQSFAEHAADSGALVLSAACSETEDSMPFSAIAQAFQHAPIPVDQLHTLQVIAPDEDCLSFLSGDRADLAERVEQIYPPVMNHLWRALLDLSAQRPIVIVIDNVEHADAFSLRGLSFIARRVRSARVMVVVAAQTGTRRSTGFLQSEVLRQPLWKQIRLTPMPLGDVAAMLERRLGDSTAAGAWYDISRGNPLLLRALMDDHSAACGAGRRSPEPVVGQSFAEAMSACLHRCGPELAEVARATAVLGDRATTDLVADLLGTPAETVGPWIGALESAGVLAEGRFSHPAGRAAVLAPLTPRDSARLHLRAAERLYYAGAAPTAVAEVLLSAHEDELPRWSGILLREAGHQALLEGRVDRVAEYLELAHRTASAPRDRVAVLNLLASAHWRSSPAGSARHVDRLLDAAREDSFDGNISLMVGYLLWQKRFSDAETLLNRMAPPGREIPVRTRVQLKLLRLRLAYHSPGLLGQLSPTVLPTELGTEEPGLEISMSPQLQAIRALEVVLAGGNPDEAAEHAEHVLQNCGLDDGTDDMLLTMLAVLVDVDRAPAALPWCEALMAEAESRRAWAWLALLLDIRAGIALRMADFPAAAEFARRALATLPIEHWTLFPVGPLVTQLHAYTAMGRHTEVAALLMQPVPEDSIQTTSGLQYWHAKGLYHLSTNRTHAAMTTFRACGELSVAWKLDIPALLPWRSGLAHTLLHAGQTEQARTLLREQLGKAHRQHSRVRGVSLRLLAHTVELSERPRLLKESIEQLQSCRALLDQAHALVDLSHVLHRLGDVERSRLTVRRAWLLANKCQAKLVSNRRPFLAPDDARQAIADDAVDESASVLSEAEQRVAALASRGDKNQEIARKLSITVSTVEQHLTRVYRKLKVHRRTELPGALEMLAVDHTLSAVGSY